MSLQRQNIGIYDMLCTIAAQIRVRYARRIIYVSSLVLVVG